MTIVNEAGLYHVLFTMEPNNARGISDDEIAERQNKLKAFKRWITHDVIPTIRKHGAYMTPEVIEKTLYNPDFIINLATELKAEREKRIQLEADNVKLSECIDGYDKLFDMLSKETLSWGNRPILDQIMRSVANARAFGGNYAKAWNTFYKNLRQKFSIDLRSRKGASPLDIIKEDEWCYIFNVAVGMVVRCRLSLPDIINEINSIKMGEFAS